MTWPRSSAALLALVLLALPVGAEVFTWVDEDGVTHFADDPAVVPDGARSGREARRDLWEDGVATHAPSPERAPQGQRDARLERQLRGAIDDLERGETARATVALEGILRLQPAQPDAHWYLALLARQRGRYELSEAHLRRFLASAGDAHEARRLAAQRKLQQLADERRLADETQLAHAAAWVGVQHPHFHVYYDAALGAATPGYGPRVMGYLEAAYREVGDRLGSVPDAPLGVMLYGKAAYLRAHRHRFSFQTVGFFDGRIHVVSAAHPAGELRALLFHEYTHAVFREQSGGDRPFWLNEGMAELSERASRKQAGLTRGERSSLRRRIDAGQWIRLRRIAPSFAGLDDGSARAAYLVSTAAAEWIVAHSTRAQRRAILEGLDAGLSDDEALVAAIGLDTEAIDAGVQAWVRAEFAPARVLPESEPSFSRARRAGETPPAAAP